MVHEKYWKLLTSGQNEAADMVEKEMEMYKELLECAGMRRNFPDRPTHFLREQTVHSKKEKDEMEEDGLWWQSELKETFLESHIAKGECEPFSVQISNFAYCMINIIEPDLSPFEYQEVRNSLSLSTTATSTSHRSTVPRYGGHITDPWDRRAARGQRKGRMGGREAGEAERLWLGQPPRAKEASSFSTGLGPENPPESFGMCMCEVCSFKIRDGGVP